MEKIYLSRKKFQELSEELEKRKTETRKEVSARLIKAKEMGDLKENADYADAKDLQAFNEARIFELDDILRNAEISDGDACLPGAVNLGCTVKVTDGEKEKVFKIVGQYDSNPEKGEVSIESPIGQALLSHRTGEEIEIKTPSRVLKYKIISVD